MERKKGISPVVAVVLMVAVAISIGIFVTLWITHWVVEKTGSTSIQCPVTTNYVIESAQFTNSTCELLIKVTNKGDTELYGFGVEMDNGTVIMTFNSSYVYQGNVSVTNKVEREQSVYLRVENTSLSINGANFTRAIGRTLEEVRVTNEVCKAVSETTKTIIQA